MFLPIPKIDYYAIWNIDENALRPTWKKPPAYSINIGDPVGWVHRSSNKHTDYYIIRVVLNRQSYVLARIMYYIYYGKDPGNLQVDHLNGDPLDNRKCNINPILVNTVGNSKNLKKYKNNTTGITGIHAIFPKGRMLNTSYQGYIWHKNKRETFTSIDFFEACCWRKSMEVKYGIMNARRMRRN